MKKILSIVAFLSFAFLSVQAQNVDIKPKECSYLSQNDFMVSLNFGVGSYINQPAPLPNVGSYNLSAPMNAWFDKSPIFDLEARWMMTDRWAMKLTGGLAYSYNPDYSELTGTGYEEGDVPTYQAVPSSNNLQFAVGLGFDYYIPIRDNFFFRVGFEGGYAYGRVIVHGVDDEAYFGASIGEAYAFRGAPVCGLDYFFAPSFLVGIDVRPVSYNYSVHSIRPQVGLSLLSSDSHQITAISQPMLKIGYRF